MYFGTSMQSFFGILMHLKIESSFKENISYAFVFDLQT